MRCARVVHLGQRHLHRLMITCDHWRDVGSTRLGVCVAGHFGGRPSHGVCGVCPHRVAGGIAQVIAPAPQPQLSIVGKIASWAKAEASLLLRGPLELEQVDARLSECRACDQRADEIDGAQDAGGVGFCNACGCGGNKRAALSVKATMPDATCPLKKWPIVEA